MGTSPAKKFLGFYQSTALIVFNTMLAACVLNAVCYLALQILTASSKSQNVVAQRHENAPLRDVYPGLDDHTINDLLNETWAAKREVFQAYTHFGESPRTGKYVNVHAGGFRLSANQAAWPPDPKAYNIFLFGGSTAFGYGLPDDQTVASYLQKSIGAWTGRTVHVYNFGSGGYQSTQERILFQELLAKGLRPNMAIFIDGLNDFAFRHVPMYTDEFRRLVNERNSRQGWPGIVLQATQALPVTQLAKAIRSRISRRAVPLAQEATLEQPECRRVVESVAQRYFENKRQIEEIARAHEIEPVFVWQPIQTYRCNKSGPRFPDLTGTNRYASAGYKYISSAAETQQQGSNFLWCADFQRELSEPLYVDTVHYTAAMSYRLAEYVARLLAERKLLPA